VRNEDALTLDERQRKGQKEKRLENMSSGVAPLSSSSGLESLVKRVEPG